MVFRFFISDWHHINNDFFNPNSEHSEASSKDSSQTEVPSGMFNVKLTFQNSGSIHLLRDRHSNVMEVNLVLTHSHWWDKAYTWYMEYIVYI